ncbi:MAG: RNA polymerase sigma factor [Bacteroidetes bacterium]|nr:RNA polymerase sigma factor [Rhodothermia bacterium]MCS7154712.1 RNA polymerase sigma factor [Bacteroidota bacterium]MCX7907131.1 RNA polymerase sigma factor [Bacteroidota bacterium]MDW8137505.1 RNA polymerase sigma factor [Bacteroidota bacterium]MDW8285541.1 RNA polymerase sigma factor [Bacteroidota bacterium]
MEKTRWDKTAEEAWAEEAALLEAFRNGCREEAFTELVRRYQERIYGLIRRLVRDHATADDLTQEVFLRAWEGLGRFRGQARLYSWLYRIALNVTMSYFRKQRLRRWIRLEELLPIPVDPAEDPAEVLELEERQRALERAVERLPPKQRMVFMLRYFENLRYEEISQLLGRSVGALKANYHHAVAKLGRYLNPNKPNELL